MCQPSAAFQLTTIGTMYLHFLLYLVKGFRVNDTVIICISNSELKRIINIIFYDGFLNYYSRMTERCAMLISAIAMETSCEGCARICKAMGMKISGDSVIRLLIRRFEQQEESPCPDVVGIDDFAFRKRSSYGTIIVDGETHKPIDILNRKESRNGGVEQHFKTRIFAEEPKTETGIPEIWEPPPHRGVCPLLSSVIGSDGRKSC